MKKGKSLVLSDKLSGIAQKDRTKPRSSLRQGGSCIRRDKVRNCNRGFANCFFLQSIFTISVKEGKRERKRKEKKQESFKVEQFVEESGEKLNVQIE